jgi:hypothetical protein
MVAWPAAARLNKPMAKKVKFNVFVDEALAKQFKAVAHVFYNRMGLCLSAAMLQFLQLDPKEQAALMKRVFEMDLADETEAAVQAAKAEQLRRINAREQKEKKGT